jgi:hypothetical protein
MASELSGRGAIGSRRFRQPLSEGQLALSFLYLLLGAIGLYGWRSRNGLLDAAIYFAIGIGYMAGYFTNWWELRPNGLFERRLWRTRTVPYSNMVTVAHKNGDTNSVEISYIGGNPSQPASMTVPTSNRVAFLDPLRSLAFGADFPV